MIADRFSTPRIARMLLLELAVARQAERAEQLAIAIDGGMGAQAVAIISAIEPGPRRDFELAAWAQRLHDADERAFAHIIHPDASQAELDAISDLSTVLVIRHGWGMQ